MKKVKVYIVRENADSIEGRGPMELHKVFSTLGKARKYVRSTFGTMGTPQPKKPYVDNFVEPEKNIFKIEIWNGYDIIEMVLE